MINEDLDQNISIFQFKTSMLQAANNDQQFFIINFIVAFCENYILAIKNH